jgi:hypothetical protein
MMKIINLGSVLLAGVAIGVFGAILVSQVFRATGPRAAELRGPAADGAQENPLESVAAMARHVRAIADHLYELEEKLEENDNQILIQQELQRVQSRLRRFVGREVVWGAPVTSINNSVVNVTCLQMCPVGKLHEKQSCLFVHYGVLDQPGIYLFSKFEVGTHISLARAIQLRRGDALQIQGTISECFLDLESHSFKINIANPEVMEELRGYPGMILLTPKDLWRLPSRYPCGCSGKRPPPGPLQSA